MPVPQPALTWRDRARRVREGEVLLADVPTAVDTDEVRRLLAAVLNRTFDSVVLCDRTTGEYLEVSDSFCQLTGFDRSNLLGQTSATLGLVDPNGARQLAGADVEAGREGIYANLLTRKDGTERHVEFSHQFVDDDHLVVIVRDVTDRHLQSLELQRLAAEDELTSVLNRRGFAQRVTELLTTARAGHQPVHLLLADVDGLKAVNDELGHEFGDRLLQLVAQALSQAAGPSAAVGRIGGDEFAIAVAGTDGFETLEGRVHDLVSRRHVGPAGSTRPISISSGTTTAARGATTLDRLLAAADTDLYRAKRARPRVDR